MDVSNLCEKCAAFDLEEAFKIDPHKKNMYGSKIVFKLTPSEMQMDTCALCQFLDAVYGIPKVPYNTWTYQLRACSMGAGILKPIKKFNFGPVDPCTVGVLALDNGHDTEIEYAKRYYLALLPDYQPAPWTTWAPRLIDPYIADFDAMRYWLDFCSKSHPQCRHTNPPAPAHTKLIDCWEREIVKALPEHEYIALSYVWGKGHENTFWEDIHAFDGEVVSLIKYPLPLPRQLPQVVADAICVANEIGKRYLWVDQYCIDQVDYVGKLAEIGMMHSIYEGASLTIVACAGKSAGDGLPGVGPRSRNPQLGVLAGGKTLVSTCWDPIDRIRSSVWMTRGWTLQEATFSRRRLYFTNEQVYFECAGMNCHESISAPLQELGPEVFNRKLFASQPAGGIYSNDIEKAYLESVALYNERQLTNLNDTLHAFRGILRAFETAQPPLNHCWGVPCHSAQATSGPERYFAHALLWQFPTNVVRRPEFPSWSWLGWTGVPIFRDSVRIDSGIRYGKANDGVDESRGLSRDRGKLAPETEIRIWAKKKDGTLLPFNSTSDAAKVTAEFDKLSTHLVIETAVFPFQLVHTALPETKVKTTSLSTKLSQLQNLVYKLYTEWKRTQHVPESVSCTCTPGLVVPDPDAENEKGTVGGRRVHLTQGMEIKDTQFLLKSQTNICQAHAPPGQQFGLVLLGFHPNSMVPRAQGNRVQKFIGTAVIKMSQRVKNPWEVDLNFLLVRFEAGKLGVAERVGFVRAYDEDGEAWRGMLSGARRRIELG